MKRKEFTKGDKDIITDKMIKPIVLIALTMISILYVTEPESAKGWGRFLTGGSFIRQKVIIHTPPERGFINRHKSETHPQEQTPVNNTDDLITS